MDYLGLLFFESLTTDIDIYIGKIVKVISTIMNEQKLIVQLDTADKFSFNFNYVKSFLKTSTRWCDTNIAVLRGTLLSLDQEQKAKHVDDNRRLKTVFSRNTMDDKRPYYRDWKEV